jgi:hypothetical protein
VQQNRETLYGMRSHCVLKYRQIMSWPAFRFVLIVIAVTSVPTAASANAVFPITVFMWPAMVVALLPVIAVETWVVSKLGRLGFRSSMRLVAGANLLSTVLGIPLAWLLADVSGLVRAGLMAAARESGDLDAVDGGPYASVVQVSSWAAVTEFAFTIGVAFLVSCVAEVMFAERKLGSRGAVSPRKALLWANVVSYVPLGAIIYLLWFGV